MCPFVITQIGISRLVFAARGADFLACKPLLNADLEEAAAWVNAPRDWAPFDVGGPPAPLRCVHYIVLDIFHIERYNCPSQETPLNHPIKSTKPSISGCTRHVAFGSLR
jgi:hypothetical protein